MTRTVNEVMTHDPRTVAAEATLTDAARFMRESDVGAIVMERDGAIRGIVTDRDIVVRAVADGRDPESTRVEEVASSDPLVTVRPEQPVDDVRRLMREHDVRRVVVEDGGRAAGMVSLGDLAVQGDADPELTDVSAASPNR